MEENVMAQLKHTFRPEFVNRIDELIVFQSLTEDELKKIVDLLLKDLRQRLQDNGYALEISDEARSLILKEGYDPAYGARPLKRAIQKLVEDKVSEEILKKSIAPGDTIKLDAVNGEMTVNAK